MGMGLGAVLEMGKRVACNTIGPTLQDNEFRLCLGDELFHPGPDQKKGLVIRTGQHGDIKFGSSGCVFAGLAAKARAGVEKTAIFMQISKDQIRILLECIEDTVTMVGIDVHIGHPLYAVAGTQAFNGNTTVIKDTEASR